jgi:hypothetical protein
VRMVVDYEHRDLHKGADDVFVDDLASVCIFGSRQLLR